MQGILANTMPHQQGVTIYYSGSAGLSRDNSVCCRTSKQSIEHRRKPVEVCKLPRPSL
jgi:hypothetical protein